MSKKLEIIVFAIIIIALVGWGEYIIPTKLEVSDAQVVEVIGLDAGETDDISVSLLFEPHKGEDEKDGPKEKVLTVTAGSFIGTEEGIQNYEDKIFIGSHVKDVVIGEQIAKEDFIRAIDFLSKNNEFRLDTKIYIAKESAASELFFESIDNGYIVSKRIDKLSLSDRGEREIRSVEIIDVVKSLLAEDKIVVIPCIEIVENGEKQMADYIINTSKEENKRVELAGYALFKDGKLFSYLGNIESMGYDYIKNLISEEGIKLVDGDDVIGIAMTGSSSKMKYEFSGDTLNKVVISIDTTNSVLETSSGKNVFAGDIERLQELENSYIKDVIKSTIQYSQNVNIDFLGIGENLELNHPYKWRNIKENWNEMFSTIPIEVEVNSKIKEQYGILSTTGKN